MSDENALQEMYANFDKAHIKGRWSIRDVALPNEPSPTSVPWLWSGEEIRRLASDAAELVPIDRGGDRRVLGLINPGHKTELGITATLWAGIQVLNPGEAAPAHRHTSSAFRFFLEGEGSYTVVDGERCNMSKWDLVLTALGTWHDHYNEGEAPVYWLDALDTPLVRYMAATFYEEYPDYTQKVTAPLDASASLFAAGGVVPGDIGTDTWETRAPLLVYKWSTIEGALAKQRATLAPDGEVGVSLRYVNPTTGGPILTTLDAGLAWLPPGYQTLTERTVCSRVVYVMSGSGESAIGGKSFQWGPGDVMVAPSWAPISHRTAEKGALFMSYNDSPVLKAMGLWRRELLNEEGDPVTGALQPGIIPGSRAKD